MSMPREEPAHLCGCPHTCVAVRTPVWLYLPKIGENWVEDCEGIGCLSTSLALLYVHCCMCTALCALLYVHCCMCTALCALLYVHCCMCTALCALLYVHCCMCTAVCALLYVHCSMCTAVCALFREEMRA